MTPRLKHKGPQLVKGRELAQEAKSELADRELTAGRESDLVNSQDPEQAGIFLAACQIVISGYRAELVKEKGSSLYVRAAYELLHHFLEEQFTPHSRLA